MKKYLYLIACVCIAITSCDSIGGGKNSGPILKPDEQKVKVEETATELMDIMDSKDYKDLAQTSSAFYSALDELTDDDYDFSEVENVVEQMIEDSFQKEDIPNGCAITMNFFLANFKGLVTFGKDKATYQDYDGTKLVWTDSKNDTWTAEISQSGTIKTMDFDTFVSEMDWYDEIHTHTYDLTIGVPEKVTAYMSRNGEKIAEVTVNLKVDVKASDVELKDDIPYVKKGSVSATTTIKVADLTLTVEPSYSVTTGQLKFAQSLYKGKQLIVKTSASCTGKVYDIIEDEEYTITNVNIHADILGKIQVSGTCSDVAGMIEYIENSYPESKSEWQKAAAKLNSYFDVNLYFDGTSNAQASLEFECAEHYDDYFDENYYSLGLVIVFKDGSRYSIDEVYNNEEDMERVEGLYDDFEYWAGTYISLIESYFGDNF